MKACGAHGCSWSSDLLPLLSGYALAFLAQSALLPQPRRPHRRARSPVRAAFTMDEFEGPRRGSGPRGCNNPSVTGRAVSCWRGDGRERCRHHRRGPGRCTGRRVRLARGAAWSPARGQGQLSAAQGLRLLPQRSGDFDSRPHRPRRVCRRGWGRRGARSSVAAGLRVRQSARTAASPSHARPWMPALIEAAVRAGVEFRPGTAAIVEDEAPHEVHLACVAPR